MHLKAFKLLATYFINDDKMFKVFLFLFIIFLKT